MGRVLRVGEEIFICSNCARKEDKNAWKEVKRQGSKE